MPYRDLFLREVIATKDEVHAGAVELSKVFSETDTCATRRQLVETEGEG